MTKLRISSKHSKHEVIDALVEDYETIANDRILNR